MSKNTLLAGRSHITTAVISQLIALCHKSDSVLSVRHSNSRFERCARLCFLRARCLSVTGSYFSPWRKVSRPRPKGFCGSGLQLQLWARGAESLVDANSHGLHPPPSSTDFISVVLVCHNLVIPFQFACLGDRHMLIFGAAVGSPLLAAITHVSSVGKHRLSGPRKGQTRYAPASRGFYTAGLG